ncbi:MAG: hypothetical protein HYR84_01545 [Planctomycetes bacterium]|nr:hypothetical protein [Planctomycetota bacterium]
METFLYILGIATAVGGFIVVCLQIRNHFLQGRTLPEEPKKADEEKPAPAPKVVQNAGRDAIYIDQSQDPKR